MDHLTQLLRQSEESENLLLAENLQRIPEEWRDEFVTMLRGGKTTVAFNSWFIADLDAMDLCEQILRSDKFMNYVMEEAGDNGLLDP